MTITYKNEGAWEHWRYWVYFRVVGTGYQRPLDHWQDAQRLDSLTAPRGQWLDMSEAWEVKCFHKSLQIVKAGENSFLVKCGASLKPISLLLQISSLMWGMETDTCKSLANEPLKASCKKYQTTNHLGPTSNMALNCDILSTWGA